MKKIIFLLIAASSLIACKKTQNVPMVSFDIPYYRTETVPAVPGYSDGATIPPGGIAMPFAAANVFTNAQQYFVENNVGQDKIITTYLGGMNVQILTQGDHYFDFLDRIELYMSNAGEPEVMVAYDDNIPVDTKSINLTLVPGVNLKNYVVGDSVTVRYSAYVNYVPAPWVVLQSRGVFNVIAKQ